MNRLFWSIIVIFLLGCESQHALSSQIIVTTFDYTTLSIPTKYLLPSLSSSLSPSKEMDTDYGGISLRIPLQDLGYDIKNNVGFYSVIHLSTTPLSSVRENTQIPPSGIDAWNGYGSYKNRIIEFDNLTQLHRVYGTKYRRSWQFFKSSPSPEKSPTKEWVAECNINFSEKNLSNLSSITCKTVFIYKDIYTQMTFSGEYLHLLDEFEERVKALFNSWETSN